MMADTLSEITIAFYYRAEIKINSIIVSSHMLQKHFFLCPDLIEYLRCLILASNENSFGPRMIGTICTRYFIYASFRLIRVIIYKNIFNSIIIMENYGNIEIIFENIN